jgi:superfamily II DNA helicase RecQ
MILSNELLLSIAETRPKTSEELASLPGMGPQRLEHYGPTILDLVQLYPPREGDEQLLAAQRQAQAEAEKGDTPKQMMKKRTISPQVERRIFLKLQEFRQKKAVHERTKPYLIANNSLLKSIAQAAPTTVEDLEKIAGFRTSGLYEEAG